MGYEFCTVEFRNRRLQNSTLSETVERQYRHAHDTHRPSELSLNGVAGGTVRLDLIARLPDEEITTRLSVHPVECRFDHLRRSRNGR
jgi:hypothetical protein